MNRLHHLLPLALLAASLAPAPVLAQPGVLDPTFGDGGVTLFDAVEANAIAFQPDGKIVASGHASGDATLFRYTSDGALDPTFGTGGTVTLDLGGPSDYFLDVEVLPTGAILAAGAKFLGVGGDDAVVARFLPDGSLDPAFGTGGLVVEPGTGGTPDAYWFVDVRPDGRIVAGGMSGDFGGAGADVCYAVQYLEDGTRDAAFGTNGVVAALEGAYCLEGALLPDGRYALAVYDPPVFALTAIRLLDNGALDPTFDGDGIAVASGVTGSAGSIEAASNGALTLVAVDSSYHITLVRFTPEGALDPTFGTNGVASHPALGSIRYGWGSVPQSDGKILVAGAAVLQGATIDVFLARVLPDGALDAKFGSGGFTHVDFGQPDLGNDVAWEIGLQPDGRIVVPGTADAGTPSESGFVARFASDQPVAVSAAPVDPPVEVEPGGTFDLTVILANVTAQPQTVQAWTAVTGAAAREPVLGPRTVTLPPGASVTRTLTQEVPANAPAGPYVYHVRAGDFPSGVAASAAFPVMVYRPEAALIPENGTGDWTVRGWDEGRAPAASTSAGLPHASARAEAPPRRTATRTTSRPPLRPGTLAAARSWSGRAAVAPAPAGASAGGGVPAALALHAAQPNPFTAETVLGYDLPAAGRVRLALYDVLGREVAVLVDGEREAGRHAATLDGLALPSGAYVVRLEAGGAVLTQRLTRVH
jgi:uncharacterized delta-60 repeat protein